MLNSTVKMLIKQCIKHIAPWVILASISYATLHLGLKTGTHSINLYILLAALISMISCGLFYLAQFALKKIKRYRAAKRAKPQVTPKANNASSQKTFLITGANRGIGLALAEELFHQGHHVIATARNGDTLTHHSILNTETERLTLATLDVTDTQSIHALSRTLKGMPIDVIINNAAMAPDRSDLATLDIDQLDEAFKTNASGPLRLIQTFMPNLLKSEHRKVINISSDLGSFGRANPCTLYAYQATKSALNMLTVLCNKELKDKGFTCLAIHPGPVKTRLNVEGVVAPEDSAKAIINLIESSQPDKSGQWLDYQGKVVPW